MDRLSTNGEMLSQIDLRNVPHSSFDLRNHNFLTGKLGKLIVTRCDEVYPGDRLKGNVQNVVNFEPLASPLMGTMVDKQESFYVPYSIIWKNAHNFFTGKKGFNKPMPSVSPFDVFDAFNEQELLVTCSSFLNWWYDDYIAHGTQANVALYNLFDAQLTMLNHYGLAYGVSDLLSPLTKRLHKMLDFDHDNQSINFSELIIKFTAAGGAATGDAIDDFLNYVCDYLEFEYNFLFGVSSHLDYIGWPVMDNWHDYFFKKPYSNSYLAVTPSDYVSYRTLFEDSQVIPDHGFPLDGDVFSTIKLNFLPLRAAYAIWYWNYRDELLETDALDPESDEFLADTCSADQIILCSLLRVRCWYKDTFTTALTNTGDGNLVVPTTLSAIDDTYTYTYFDSENKLINTSDHSQAISSGATICRISVGDYSYDVPMNYLSSNFEDSAFVNENYVLSLDLLDRVSRLRRFIQKKLILGYEYDDVIWSNFMVKLSNVRMRIPELLSRGRDVVQINTIVNNTNTTEQIAGDKTAVAWANGQGSHIDYFAEEHGLYLSYMTILPIQSYAGGLSRKFCKLKPFDFMWPEFAIMGMDAVYNYELSAPRGSFASSGLDDDNATNVFGYQGRYYDLKSKLDEEHGRLRTDLNYLTFSREWNMDNKPKLNYIFVHCWPSVNPFVVGDDEDCFRADISHDLDFYRRLPVPSEIV